MAVSSRGSMCIQALESPSLDWDCRSEEHTSELQSHSDLVCRLLLEGTLRQACSFFFNDTATTEIYTLSLHDALPISSLVPKASLTSLKLRPSKKRSTTAF